MSSYVSDAHLLGEDVEKRQDGSGAKRCDEADHVERELRERGHYHASHNEPQRDVNLPQESARTKTIYTLNCVLNLKLTLLWTLQSITLTLYSVY